MNVIRRITSKILIPVAENTFCLNWSADCAIDTELRKPMTMDILCKYVASILCFNKLANC